MGPRALDPEPMALGLEPEALGPEDRAGGPEPRARDPLLRALGLAPPDVEILKRTGAACMGIMT